MECRRQAASESGYRGPESGASAEDHYAEAYYGCMDAANGPPPPGNYAYGPPPSPYYYGPYPYPYYYPPYYYGPGVTFGFRVGGYHGRWR
jgi:hypothetical protein